jgi:hypothetical protein
MVGISGTSKSGIRHSYYVCTNRWRNKACNKNNESKEELENDVFNEILEHISKTENLVAFASGIHSEYERNCNTAVVKDFERRIAQVDKELDRCFDMMLNADTEEIKNRANAKAKDLEIQKRDLQTELAKLKKAQGLKNKTLEDILAGLQAVFAVEDIGIERRQRLIDSLVVAVLVSDSERIVLIDEDGLDKLDCTDWQEWYNDIDWDMVYGDTELDNKDDDDKGNNNGGCGGCGSVDNNSGNSDTSTSRGVRILNATPRQQ